MIYWIRNIEFANWWWLSLLLALPILYWWYKTRIKKQSAHILISTTEPIQELKTLRSRLHPYLPLLNLIGVIGLIIALARPQLILKEEEVKAEGIDIVITMDKSLSMLSKDFEPNRLEASKEVAKSFVDKRTYDRIGLVVFSGESYTQCPLTTDHRVLKDFITDVTYGLIEDGTAIGMGLSSAINRMKESEAESKVIILLTDGENNRGYVKPMTAAEIAKEYGIKVYTIGVGTEGYALMATGVVGNRVNYQQRASSIDEELLTEMAELTGGKYYRATDEAALEAIYDEIDLLEKTEMEVTTFKRHSEEFRPFLIFGLGMLLLNLILRMSIFKTIP